MLNIIDMYSKIYIIIRKNIEDYYPTIVVYNIRCEK